MSTPTEPVQASSDIKVSIPATVPMNEAPTNEYDVEIQQTKSPDWFKTQVGFHNTLYRIDKQYQDIEELHKKQSLN
jgi:hypothetical protein